MVLSIFFYVLLVLFILLIISCWFSNLFGLPGNWLIILASLIWFLCTDPETRWHIGWPLLILFVVLAGIGELIEFAAAVLGTKRVGGSQRAATFSVIGSVTGGIVGGIFGLPIAIPLVGMVIGSVLFACMGALIGAALAEKSLGAETGTSLKVGGAAFVGRFVGTVGKITLGSVILALAIFSLFL